MCYYQIILIVDSIILMNMILVVSHEWWHSILSAVAFGNDHVWFKLILNDVWR